MANGPAIRIAVALARMYSSSIRSGSCVGIKRRSRRRCSDRVLQNSFSHLRTAGIGVCFADSHFFVFCQTPKNNTSTNKQHQHLNQQPAVLGQRVLRARSNSREPAHPPGEPQHDAARGGPARWAVATVSRMPCGRATQSAGEHHGRRHVSCCECHCCSIRRGVSKDENYDHGV